MHFNSCSKGGPVRRRRRFLQGVVKWKGEESRLNANYRSWDPVTARRGERSRWWVVCLPTLSCEINDHFGFHKMRADDIQSFIFQPTSLPPTYVDVSLLCRSLQHVRLSFTQDEYSISKGRSCMRVPACLIYIGLGYIMHPGLISSIWFKHEDQFDGEILAFIHCRALYSCSTIWRTLTLTKGHLAFMLENLTGLTALIK